MLEVSQDISQKVTHVQQKPEHEHEDSRNRMYLCATGWFFKVVCPCELRPDSAPHNDNLPMKVL